MRPSYRIGRSFSHDIPDVRSPGRKDAEVFGRSPDAHADPLAVILDVNSFGEGIVPPVLADISTILCVCSTTQASSLLITLVCYYGTVFTRVTVPPAQNKFGGHRPVND